jgi:transcription elongation factor GreA
VSRKGGSTVLSDQARERIGAESAQLRQRRERLLGDLEADEDTRGDRGDAADEIQLAEQLEFLDRRIADLDDLLHCAASVSAREMLPDGAEVTLRFPDGQVATMRVISEVEQIPVDEHDESLTGDSPLGLALAGHQPGDTVTYSTPEGQQRVELVAVKLST